MRHASPGDIPRRERTPLSPSAPAVSHRQAAHALSLPSRRARIQAARSVRPRVVGDQRADLAVRLATVVLPKRSLTTRFQGAFVPTEPWTASSSGSGGSSIRISTSWCT